MADRIAPPPYPAPPTPRPRRSRRVTAWTVGVVAVLSAALGATLAGLITSRVSSENAVSVTSTTVTVTAQPTTPAPLPAAVADRSTCQAYSSAGKLLQSATTTLQVIPADKTVLDPAVRASAEMAAAVQKAAALYGQAADAIKRGTAPGTSAVLADSAAALNGALSSMATAYRTYDANVADVYEVGKAADGALAALCTRLAPR
ncbi:hypothetical protein [Mycolicibacterium llatzerense]|uniref:hypothetical protein n=1 Tax=Mycolicibacterium llatzerense TaxID=280871 RepID=UPI0021B66A3F|nr:hypothetical protein [Mycolicibacterium llatzerense]MCT7373149.1 hypothetical protein [Mycolicibacterium llatzerense]